jgi:hypothetical protein
METLNEQISEILNGWSGEDESTFVNLHTLLVKEQKVISQNDFEELCIDLENLILKRCNTEE